MLITGDNLMKKVLLLMERENEIHQEVQQLEEKSETAKNLQNRDELVRLGSEGAKLHRQITTFMIEKAVVMSMVISNNPNFQLN